MQHPKHTQHVPKNVGMTGDSGRNDLEKDKSVIDGKSRYEVLHLEDENESLGIGPTRNQQENNKEIPIGIVESSPSKEFLSSSQNRKLKAPMIGDNGANLTTQQPKSKKGESSQPSYLMGVNEAINSMAFSDNNLTHHNVA